MKMSIVFLVCSIFYMGSMVAATETAFEILKNYQTACQQENNLSHKELEAVRLAGKIPNESDRETMVPKLKKFALCMMKKFKIINDDGTINKDEKTLQLLSKNKAKALKTFESCTADLDGPADHKASELLLCLYLGGVKVYKDFGPH